MTLGILIASFWLLVLAALHSFGKVQRKEEQVHIRGRRLQSDKQMQGDLDDD